MEGFNCLCFLSLYPVSIIVTAVEKLKSGIKQQFLYFAIIIYRPHVLSVSTPRSGN